MTWSTGKPCSKTSVSTPTDFLSSPSTLNACKSRSVGGSLEGGGWEVVLLWEEECCGVLGEGLEGCWKENGGCGSMGDGDLGVGEKSRR